MFEENTTMGISDPDAVQNSSEDTNRTSDVRLQDASLDIWDKKYRLKNKNGEPLEEDIDGTIRRVAGALASVEREGTQHIWAEKFEWAMKNGAIPAGRILSNAGAQEFKPKTSTINCTVSGTIADSMDDILNKVHEAGITLKAGCGIGYEFSTLRPSGAFVDGSGSVTSGPLGFMDIYDKTCFTVASAGGRRGAQMATFDISHPNVLDFIQAKREDGRLRQFNCSVLITDEFVKTVKDDGTWEFFFPCHPKEVNDEDVVERRVGYDNIFTGTEHEKGDGVVPCKIYGTMAARDLWDIIMKSTYDFAEPGFILIDEINRMNNLWFCENIRATNPCLPGDAVVETYSHGPMTIGEIVQRINLNHQQIHVISYNTETGKTEVDLVTDAQLTKKDAEILELEFDDGEILRLTPDHLVFTKNRGYVEAQDLDSEDIIVSLQ